MKRKKNQANQNDLKNLAIFFFFTKATTQLPKKPF